MSKFESLSMGLMQQPLPLLPIKYMKCPHCQGSLSNCIACFKCMTFYKDCHCSCKEDEFFLHFDKDCDCRCKRLQIYCKLWSPIRIKLAQ